MAPPWTGWAGQLLSPDLQLPSVQKVGGLLSVAETSLVATYNTTEHFKLLNSSGYSFEQIQPENSTIWATIFNAFASISYYVLRYIFNAVASKVSNTWSYIYIAFTSTPPLLVLASIAWLYFCGYFFFDTAHWILHQCWNSKSPILHRIGYIHQVHHLYFNRRLKYNKRYIWQNTLMDTPLKVSCQYAGTWLGYKLAGAFGLTGPGMLTPEIYRLMPFIVALIDGMDGNHIEFDTMVPKDKNILYVGPEYHAMHHVNPTSYIGANFRLFDLLFGTSYTLRSRRITLTGTTGAFGSAMKAQLEKESVSCINELEIGTDWKIEDHPDDVKTLENTDVLILTHGSDNSKETEEANCTSAMALIELFKSRRKARRGDLVLPEVWYVGSNVSPKPWWGIAEREAHSRNNGLFGKYVRELYDAEWLNYRHIVPSIFKSAMVAPEEAVNVAFWWISRGARYIPTSHGGLAFWGYFKFLWRL